MSLTDHPTMSLTERVFSDEELATINGDPERSEEFCIARLNEVLNCKLSSNRYTRNGMDAKDIVNRVMLEVKCKSYENLSSLDRKFAFDIQEIVMKSNYAMRVFIYMNLSPEIEFQSMFIAPPIDGVLVFRGIGKTFTRYQALTLREAIIANRSMRRSKVAALIADDETNEDEHTEVKHTEVKINEVKSDVVESNEVKINEVKNNRVEFHEVLEFTSLESYRIVNDFLISRVPLSEDSELAKIQHTFEQFLCDNSLLVVNKKLQIRHLMRAAFGITNTKSAEYTRITKFIAETYHCKLSSRDFGGRVRTMQFTRLDQFNINDKSICGIPYGKTRDIELRRENDDLELVQHKPMISAVVLDEVREINSLKIEEIEPRDYIIHRGIQGSQSSGNLIAVLGMLIKFIRDNPSIKSIEDIESKLCLQLRDGSDDRKYNIRTIYNKYLKRDELTPVSMKIEEIIGGKRLLYVNISQGKHFVDEVASLFKRCLAERIHFSDVKVRFNGANGVSSLAGLYNAQCQSILTKDGRCITETDGEYHSFKLNVLNNRRAILKTAGSETISQLRELGLSVVEKNDGVRKQDAMRMFDINNM